MAAKYDIVRTNTIPTPDEPTYQYKCVYLYGPNGMVDSGGWHDTESSAMSCLNNVDYPERFFVALVRRIAK